MRVAVIMGLVGEYSDRLEWPAFVVEDLEKAQRRCDEVSRWAREAHIEVRRWQDTDAYEDCLDYAAEMVHVRLLPAVIELAQRDPAAVRMNDSTDRPPVLHYGDPIQYRVEQVDLVEAMVRTVPAHQVDLLLEAMRAFWPYVEARHHVGDAYRKHPDYYRLAEAIEAAAEPLGGVVRFGPQMFKVEQP